MIDESPADSFFAPSESAELATRVCLESRLNVAPLEERSFGDGEFKLRPLVPVRGKQVFVLQSLAGNARASTADRLVRLLFLLQVLRDAGAERLIAIVPYLAYARKDRRTQIRDPVHTRYVAQLLEAAGVDRLIAIDVHNPAALDNAFRIPVDHLSLLPMLANHFAIRLADSNLIVVSPDVGGIKRAQIFRELLEARIGRAVELAFLEKRRAKGVVSGDTLVGFSGQRPTAIVIDDLCATGTTLIHAAQSCRNAGAIAVHVAVSHSPRAAGLEALLQESGIDGITTSDSVGIPIDFDRVSEQQANKLTVLSVAPLLGNAVERMLAGRSLAPLLERWPP